MPDSPNCSRRNIIWLDDNESTFWWEDWDSIAPKIDRPRYCLDYSVLFSQFYTGNLNDEATFEKLRKSMSDDGDASQVSTYIVDALMKPPFVAPNELKNLHLGVVRQDADSCMVARPSLKTSAFSLGMVFANPEEVEDQLESLKAIYRYHCGRFGHRTASFLMNWHLFLTVVWRVWTSLPVVKGINAIVQKWARAQS